MLNPVLQQPTLYGIDELTPKARQKARKLCEEYNIDEYHAWDIGFHADGSIHGLENTV